MSDYSAQQRQQFIALLADLHQKTNEGGAFSGHTFAILFTIAAGDIGGHPWDVTSLARQVRLPRQTVARKVAELVKRGFIHSEHRGRRVVYRRTAAGITHFRPVLDRMIDATIKFCEYTHPASSKR